jgi:hypothetical protein
MWRLLFLLVIVMGFYGCKDGVDRPYANDMDVVTIDGCEYLKCKSYMDYFTLTHKGNCKNPVHGGVHGCE